MNIPVTFLQHDGSDRFLVPVHVVTVAVPALTAAATISHSDAAPTGHTSLAELVRSWSVQLPHRRFRRRQRARLRLAIS